jgi:hypothetical protein
LYINGSDQPHFDWNEVSLREEFPTRIVSAFLLAGSMRLRCFPILVLSSLFLKGCGSGSKSEPAPNLVAPFLVEFQDGWSALETADGHEWHWGGARNLIVLSNELPEARVATISYDVLSLNERSLRVYQDGQILFTETLDTRAWERRQFSIGMEPGVSQLVLETDEPSVALAGETRDLRVCIRDFSIALSEENAEPSVFQVKLQFDDGWYAEELDGLHSWRWAESLGLFHVVNEAETAKTVALSFGVRTLDPRLLKLSADGMSLLAEELVPGPWIQLRQNVNLAPGVNRFAFETPTAGIKMPGDERTLSFCIQDLKIVPAL